MVRSIKSVKWSNLILELLIVFIGVYGAFQLDAYHTKKAELKNNIKYYQAFEEMLENYAAHTQNLLDKVEGLQSQFQQDPGVEIEFIHDFDFTNTIYIVESVFSSDRFSGVEAGFMANLELGANLIKSIQSESQYFASFVNEAKINQTDETKEFRIWYGQALAHLSIRLYRLKDMIENGALPETSAIIESLKVR